MNKDEELFGKYIVLDGFIEVPSTKSTLFDEICDLITKHGGKNYVGATFNRKLTEKQQEDRAMIDSITKGF